MEIPYKEIIIDFKNDKICIAFVNFALKCFLFRYVARSRNFIIARLQLENPIFTQRAIQRPTNPLIAKEREND